jgi:FKBP-type peptidyl-prolyl cis-trans isomerase (trigger factor)
LARKLKGDQVSLKAKEQMTEIESHLDKQINSLRNDLKISG